jgi:hypothetical protein
MPDIFLIITTFRLRVSACDVYKCVSEKIKNIFVKYIKINTKIYFPKHVIRNNIYNAMHNRAVYLR